MKKTISILTALFCLSINLSAQENYFSLQDCIDEALRHSLELQTANAELRNASAGMQEAFGSYLPSINGTMGYSRHLNPGAEEYTIPGIGPNSFNAGVSARWMIFDGFGREASYKISENNEDYTQYDIENRKDFVVYQVYAGYINVIRNAQLVKIRRENIKSGNQELEMIKARHEAGLLPIADVYSKEADLGNRESELIMAENNLEKSKAALLAVMGKNPVADAEFLESSLPVDITEEEIENFYVKVGGIISAEETAFKERNDYLARKVAINSAEYSVKLAYSAYSPSLSADLGWSWSDYEFNEVGADGDSYAGVSLSVPIFNNFRVNKSVQNAKLGLEQQEIAESQLEQRIRQDIKTAFLNLKASEKMIEAAKKTVKSSEQNYAAVNERFNLGSASITDLTFANMQLVTAKINQVDAVYSYIAAQKEVLYNMGVLR